jgi:hypothetical protein
MWNFDISKPGARADIYICRSDERSARRELGSFGRLDMTNKQIAQDLRIVEDTVKKHLIEA